MKALILDAEARETHVLEIQDPQPAPNKLLIKVERIALNPIDPLYVAHPLGGMGRTVGSEFVGRTVKIGFEVSASANLYNGDRVAGFVQSACSVNPLPGAFAEYVAVPWDLVWCIPDSISFEEAAGFSALSLSLLH